MSTLVASACRHDRSSSTPSYDDTSGCRSTNYWCHLALALVMPSHTSPVLVRLYRGKLRLARGGVHIERHYHPHQCTTIRTIVGLTADVPTKWYGDLEELVCYFGGLGIWTGYLAQTSLSLSSATRLRRSLSFQIMPRRFSTRRSASMWI